MLLSSQMDSGKFGVTREDINLSTLTSEAVLEYKERFPDRIINAAIEDALFISGDLLLLQMGVNNLIDNAIKYSPKNSAITIRLAAKGNHIECSVSDEGKGIADAEKKKVFEKFYRIGNTATKSAKGTGLGLFLTKRIALAHNAEIRVTDNLPNGSTFVIEFKQAAKAIA
jgi:signal transduction histidine kinase